MVRRVFLVLGRMLRAIMSESTVLTNAMNPIDVLICCIVGN